MDLWGTWVGEERGGYQGDRTRMIRDMMSWQSVVSEKQTEFQENDEQVCNAIEQCYEIRVATLLGNGDNWWLLLGEI